ncbi:MAG: CBS domain-containing protein [Rhodospirillales bacterium]|nr:CBS domain-containing protein [Rhodospirillales bacterium]
MKQLGTVNDYMSIELVTFTPDMDIHRAIRLLLKGRISGAPVLDDQGGLVGILTKKDCLKIAFSASYHQEWGGNVSDFMSRDVQTVEVDTDIVEVAERFLKSKFHRYPVMRSERLVGVISRHDVLRSLEDLW